MYSATFSSSKITTETVIFPYKKKKIKKPYPLKAKRGRKAFKKKKTTEEKTNSLILKNKRTNPVFIFLLTIAENEYKGP